MAARDDLVDPEVSELGSAQAGLDGKEQFELGSGEEVDEAALEALVGDVEDPLDLVGVVGHADSDVAEEGVDGREAGVAGPYAVLAVDLQVLEERRDQRCAELVKSDVGGSFAEAVVHEAQQQRERGLVGADRVGARLAFPSKALDEEGLEKWGQGSHGSAPKLFSSLRAATPSSSGTAERYQ
jgi:hypothetical protein